MEYFLAQLLIIFVLVELLEVIKGGDIDVDLGGLALVSVLSIGNHADLKVITGHVGEDDGADETLVLGGIVVLKRDLELDSLSELSLLDRLLELGEHSNEVLVSNFRCH